MAFYKFYHKRLTLIDAFDESRERIGPKDDQGNPIGPVIIDKKGGKEDVDKYEFFPISENAAFVLAYLLDGVDDDLVKRIYASRYGVDPSKASADVDTIITNLKGKNLIKEGVPDVIKDYEDPDTLHLTPKKFKEHLGVNFDVGLNQMGGFIRKPPGT